MNPKVGDTERAAARGIVRTTVDRALKVGRVLSWLEEHFGAGIYATLSKNPS